MKSMKSVSLLLLATLLVVPTVAMAWGNINAHPMINTEALEYFFAHEGSGEKYKYSPVDRTIVYTGRGVLEGGWFNAPNGPISKNITGWLGHGGYSADEPEVFASLRHFYDPLALNGGVSYLTDHIDEFYPSANPQMDAKTWGLTEGGNTYCWVKGLLWYKDALEKTDSREANLTVAYRALGETMHLFADMTQPAHVRNDSHPWAEPIEDNVTGAMVTGYKNYPVDSRVSLAGLPGNLFDQLATFTNQYFYSNDTIFDGPSDTLPFNELAHYPSPQFKDLTYDPKRCVYSGTFNGIPVPMIEETASFYVLKMVLLGYSARVTKYHVPPTYASGYARVLIPIAIHANAKMIDMFFPTINLTLTTTNIGNNQVRLEGQMTHDIDKDPAWQALGMGAIKYTGPGAVMTSSNGTALKVADVIFDKGVMTPININVPLSGASSLYLQVTAGGRIFTSPTKVEGVNFGMNSTFKYYGGQFNFISVGTLEARGVTLWSDTLEYTDPPYRLPWEWVRLSNSSVKGGDLVKIRWIPNISCTNCGSEEFKICKQPEDGGKCSKLRLKTITYDATLCAGGNCMGGGLATANCVTRSFEGWNSSVDMEVTSKEGECAEVIRFHVDTDISMEQYYEYKEVWIDGPSSLFWGSLLIN